MPTDFLRKRSTRVLFCLATLAIVVVAAGLLVRRSQAEKLEQGAAARAVPTVSLLSPGAMDAGALELAARVEPWARAPIYARVSGYLAGWKVDIGAPVKAGQLLATIETPDLDQQLLQAQAELASARSSLALAESTAKRWSALVLQNAVSKQEADEKRGELAARQGQVAALGANVQRLLALQRYTRLVAPFDGVVTARNTDVGALINAGGAAGSELFVVSDTRRLRVYVQVPQRQVALVRVGGKARLSVPERPGQAYAATVQSLSRSIESGSGAMLVQLAVDNAAGELLPGGFATVRFDTPAASDAITVPPGALITGRNGTQVATVDGAGRVVLKSVTVARDLGKALELAGGVAGGVTRADRIIDSPPDGIATGDPVRVAETRAAP
jgi:RND family efflux transporter MFP subunit